MITPIVAVIMLALNQITVLGIVVGLALYTLGMTRVLAADDWDLLYRLVAAMAGEPLIESAPATELSYRVFAGPTVIVTGKSPILEMQAIGSVG